jgi:hypothetical protein
MWQIGQPTAVQGCVEVSNVRICKALLGSEAVMDVS